LLFFHKITAAPVEHYSRHLRGDSTVSYQQYVFANGDCNSFPHSEADGAVDERMRRVRGSRNHDKRRLNWDLVRLFNQNFEARSGKV
jgi:hypothetical protein